MSWFRKQSAKEIARNVAEKTERWERAAEAAKLTDLVTKAQTGARIWETNAYNLAGSDLSSAADFEFHLRDRDPQQPTNFEFRQPIHPDTLSALLLAGNAMAEWLLEERPEGKDQTDRAPGWCLMCGHRGKMNEPGDHGIGCAVGLWLMSKPK
jgi:hypothetical protein